MDVGLGTPVSSRRALQSALSKWDNLAITEIAIMYVLGTVPSAIGFARAHGVTGIRLAIVAI